MKLETIDRHHQQHLQLVPVRQLMTASLYSYGVFILLIKTLIVYHDINKWASVRFFTVQL